MNGTTIAGVVVMFFGGLLMSDYKSFGMTNPAVGILVGGVGSFSRVSATSPPQTTKTTAAPANG